MNKNLIKLGSVALEGVSPPRGSVIHGSAPELRFYRSASGFIFTPYCRVPLTDNMLVFMAAGDFLNVAEGERCVSMALYPPATGNTRLARFIAGQLRSSAVVMSEDDADLLWRRLNDAFGALSGRSVKGELATLLMKNETENLVLNMVRLSADAEDGGLLGARFRANNALIERAVAYVRSAAGEPLTLSDVARAVKVTPPHLSRVFRRETGVPFSAFLRSVRLNEAARALLTTERDVTDIANGCGFYCRSYFYSAFKREFGVTPYKFRSENKI